MSATEGTQEADDLKDFRFEQLLTRISGENLIQEAPIFQFPDSVLVKIFSFLNHDDILTSVRLVCRKWLFVGRDQDIWKHCDFYYGSPSNAIKFEKFVARYRYAKGVVLLQLTFPDCLLRFSNRLRQLENLILCFKLLVHMPELKHCVTPRIFEEFQLMMFCDALGRYCPLLTSLHIRISYEHKLHLTSHSSCFNMLKRCEHLAELTFSVDSDEYPHACCVTPSFVSVLADCIPNLEDFFLESTNVLEPGCFEAFANSSLRLKKLCFIFKYPSTVDDVSCISKLKSLKSLTISFAWIGCVDLDPPEPMITNHLKAITEYGGLCDLTELYLMGKAYPHEDYNIYDDSFYFLAKNLNKLTVMTLDSLLITDVSLHNVAEHCTKLETLSLRLCTRVTDRGICYLIEKLKALKKVGLYYTGTVDIVKSIQTTYLHIDLEAIGLHTLKNG